MSAQHLQRSGAMSCVTGARRLQRGWMCLTRGVERHVHVVVDRGVPGRGWLESGVSYAWSQVGAMWMWERAEMEAERLDATFST